MKTKAPGHLRPETAAWWAKVVDSYELEEHHVRLLTLAAEAWDRCQEAREALAEHGLCYVDGGKPHPRPEVAIERDSRLAFARLLRELCLDSESAPDPLRPPVLRDTAGRR